MKILHLKSLFDSLKLLKLAFHISPRKIIYEFVIQIVDSLIQVYFTVFLIQGIMRAFQNNADFFKTLKIIIFGTCLFLVQSVLRSYYEAYFDAATDIVLKNKLNSRLFERAAKVDYKCYEDKAYYDKFSLVLRDGVTIVKTCINSIASLTACLIAVVIITTVMVSIDMITLILAFVPFLITMKFGTNLNKVSYELELKKVSPNKKWDYIKRIFTLNDYSKDIRTTNISSYLINELRVIVRIISKNITDYGTRKAIINFILIVFNQLFPFFAAFFYVVYNVFITKRLSISDLTVMVVGLSSLANQIKMVSNKFLSLHENSLFISNLNDFMNINTESVFSKDTSSYRFLDHSILLKNVNFSYDNSKINTLKNINLNIKQGEKIAIVGENGSGKSTLIKLILGLYKADAGEVIVGGNNIRLYDREYYYSNFSVIFQDFQIMASSIAENVLMKDYEEGSKDNIMHCLEEADLREEIENLKNGINTMMSKEFDQEGIVLSGGQNQKLAIARVYAKTAKIVIFDEPSSALDPIAELEMFNKMMERFKDKTIIFISHSPLCTALADKIVCLRSGEIVEEGTHNELLKNGTFYSKLYNTN